MGMANPPPFATCRRRFFIRKFYQGGIYMTEKRTCKERAVQAYWSVVGIAGALILSLQPVLADDIWSRFSTIMKDVYGELVGISTIVAVTAASVALLIRMISRNQRAVDEATSWLKRIIVTWLVLNTLGFAVAYLQPLIQGGMYNG
jgi:hypothetical protein